MRPSAMTGNSGARFRAGRRRAPHWAGAWEPPAGTRAARRLDGRATPALRFEWSSGATGLGCCSASYAICSWGLVKRPVPTGEKVVCRSLPTSARPSSARPQPPTPPTPRASGCAMWCLPRPVCPPHRLPCRPVAPPELLRATLRGRPRGLRSRLPVLPHVRHIRAWLDAVRGLRPHFGARRYPVLQLAAGLPGGARSLWPGHLEHALIKWRLVRRVHRGAAPPPCADDDPRCRRGRSRNRPCGAREGPRPGDAGRRRP